MYKWYMYTIICHLASVLLANNWNCTFKFGVLSARFLQSIPSYFFEGSKFKHDELNNVTV